MTEYLTECKALVTPSTRNGHRVFSYTLESHTAAAFAIMNELRLDRQLCDVTLRVRYKDLEEVDFVAHKVVLASSSPVFRAMFTNGLKECGMELVPIEGIHPRVSQMSFFLNRNVFDIPFHSQAIKHDSVSYHNQGDWSYDIRHKGGRCNS